MMMFHARCLSDTDDAAAMLDAVAFRAACCAMAAAMMLARLPPPLLPDASLRFITMLLFRRRFRRYCHFRLLSPLITLRFRRR